MVGFSGILGTVEDRKVGDRKMMKGKLIDGKNCE